MSAETERLSLRAADIFSTRGEPAIVEARFLVHTVIGLHGLRQIFRLRAMNNEGYDAWYTDRILLPGVEETFPLHIPTGALGSEELTDHILRTYLDPNHPDAVNGIRQYLELAESE